MGFKTPLQIILWPLTIDCNKLSAKYVTEIIVTDLTSLSKSAHYQSRFQDLSRIHGGKRISFSFGLRKGSTGNIHCVRLRNVKKTEGIKSLKINYLHTYMV